MAKQIREAQGQSHAVQVGEHSYVFKKLKRKRCHQVLHGLVAPFIRIVSTLIESVEALNLGALIRGEEDFDFDAIFKEGAFNTDNLAKLIDALPFDVYWELACNILDEVEIDGVQQGSLEDHEFFDDKPLEMAKAILKGIEVNYPFLGGLIKSKNDGSNDSSPTSQEATKK